MVVIRATVINLSVKLLLSFDRNSAVVVVVVNKDRIILWLSEGVLPVPVTLNC